MSLRKEKGGRQKQQKFIFDAALRLITREKHDTT